MNEPGALSIPVTPLDKPFARGDLRMNRMVFDPAPEMHQLVWIAGGVLGAVTFVIMEIAPVMPQLSFSCEIVNGRQWMGIDIGRHSLHPMYEDDNLHGPCPFLDGLPCYYDGTSLGAHDLLREVVRQDNEEVIWQALAYYYDSWFKGGETGVESDHEE